MNNKIIHWSYRDFRCFPKQILVYREYLEEIYLKENFIQSIPLWLFEINNLTFIHLAGNEILLIPDEICFLHNLEFFDVSGNRLKYLPNSIGSLKKLRSLNISENEIQLLPKEIGELKSLEVLYANKNVLENLPSDLGNCWSLTDITFSDNYKIKEIPVKLFLLKHLKHVEFDRCSLSYLPFNKCVTITHLRVFDNSCLNHIPYYYENFVPPNYSMKGTFNFINTLDTSNNIQIQLVGDERVINLPKMLKKIYTNKNRKPQKLINICLSAVYHSYNINYLHEMLPNYLFRLLQNPIGLCGGEFCTNYIFCECYLLLIKRNRRNDCVIISHLFCSKDCLEKWIDDKICFYHMIQWTIIS